MLKTNLTKRMAVVCLASATLLGTMSSCKKSDLSAETNATNEARIGELQRFISKSTGVAVTKIYFDKSYQEFIVDKDLGIDLADAEKRFEAAQRASGAPSANGSDQRIYDYVVTRSKAADIKIYADPSVSAEWVQVLDQAIANWNSVNSGVVMRRVTGGTAAVTSSSTSGSVTLPARRPKGPKSTTGSGSGTTSGGTTDSGTTTGGTTGDGSTSGGTTSTTPLVYDIIVNAYHDNSTSTVAFAYLPDWYGNPGFAVSINTAYNYLSTAQKIFAITHELGHNIGFTHTDGNYGSLVPGTPVTDAQSVMNSFVLSWAGFTYYDQVATRTVYPR